LTITHLFSPSSNPRFQTTFFYTTSNNNPLHSPHSHLNTFNMHASTIAAILAFTAGMSVNAAPVAGSNALSNNQPAGLRRANTNAEVNEQA